MRRLQIDDRPQAIGEVKQLDIDEGAGAFVAAGTGRRYDEPVGLEQEAVVSEIVREHCGVRSLAPVQHVIARTADQNVVAATTPEGVVAVTPNKHVIAMTANKNVVASLADKEIGAARDAVEGIVAVRSDQRDVRVERRRGGHGHRSILGIKTV